MKSRYLHLLCLGLLSMSSCERAGTERSTDSPVTQVVASATMTPNVTIYASTLSVPTTTPLPTPMNTWQPIRPGVEFLQRQERVNDMDDWVTLVRIDLATASLRVHYDPEEVRTVREWFDATQADVVINAGFFTEDKKATGLVIADGQSFGRTYKGFGGMFSLRDNEQARAVELQWLARKPYVADPSIAQAIQSFPMLLLDGEIVDGIPDDGSRNRRSFIGINRAGHVILGVCQSPVWTMTDLAQFLATSELLDLSNAVNLDGGASSGLWMRGVSEAVLVNSLEAVPTVITIN